ncbi:6116_t:CDS:2 [Gigaspora margarita]|uniref:6116_t:CDS:1 n=1 Tax=Gigaspora margarita TaxID=4874 RepID=A0ABN7UEF1_GIGMA|nr:6116_t:CDS:2 [Gigaspora margarita]
MAKLILGEIDIQPLVSTRDFLAEALEKAENKFEIAGAIQAFESDYQILRRILDKYPYQFYAYGSRVKGTARKYSDLDICYYDDIPSFILVQIEEDLEQSDLPFMIELVN